jgi:hypothetical protein
MRLLPIDFGLPLRAQEVLEGQRHRGAALDATRTTNHSRSIGLLGSGSSLSMPACVSSTQVCIDR